MSTATATASIPFRRSASGSVPQLHTPTSGLCSSTTVPASTPGAYGIVAEPRTYEPPGGVPARRQRAMVVVTMAKPKPRSSMGAQTMRGPRISAGS
jgi:hypothetical protein